MRSEPALAPGTFWSYRPTGRTRVDGQTGDTLLEVICVPHVGTSHVEWLPADATCLHPLSEQVLGEVNLAAVVAVTCPDCPHRAPLRDMRRHYDATGHGRGR